MRELGTRPVCSYKSWRRNSSRDELESLTNNIATLTELGLYPVIVHGGQSSDNTQILSNTALNQRNTMMVPGLPTPATLQSVEPGLSQVNQILVEALEAKGVSVAGITVGYI